MGKGLGLLQQTDFRDHAYPLAAVATVPPPTLTHRYWYGGDVLDQGETPQCVAYSGWKWAEAGPVRNLRLPWQDQGALYHECQEADEWEGTDYDGTSVRALFKSLQTAGIVTEYRWAWDIPTITAWILGHGPVVAGTAWADTMFNPGTDGFIRIGSGQYVGGHAYNLIGVDVHRSAFRVLNSWGSGWGENGRVWLSFADFEILLKEGGEACTATEIKLRSGDVVKLNATMPTPEALNP